MVLPESDVIALIYHLLPGFVAAWVFHGLTAHHKQSPFERTVQAVIFTAITLACVLPLSYLFGWSAETSFSVSIPVAALIGTAVATLANTNLVHAWLPDCVTKRTSYPSQWFSAFNKDKRFIVLHLKDGRRLYGWPFEWPDHCDSGHFVLMEAKWLLDDNTAVPLHLIERMLVPAADVGMVEFEKSPDEVFATDAELKAAEAALVELHSKQEKLNGRPQGPLHETGAEGSIREKRSTAQATCSTQRGGEANTATRPTQETLSPATSIKKGRVHERQDSTSAG